MQTILEPRTKLPVRLQRLQTVLNELVRQYKTPDYILSDPIQIPHRFIDDPKACELTAFITSLFSYGRRDSIIETVNTIFRLTDHDPVGFLENFDAKHDAKLFAHFVYRFNKGPDLVFLWQRLQWAYREYDSLENLFVEALQSLPEPTLKQGMAGFLDRLSDNQPLNSYGLKFLLAHPDKGGACKRLNMFLRWMVREDLDPASRVDFGLWKQSLQPCDLLIPLDTHILKMNAQLKLSSRTDGSWETAEQITRVFRLLCPEDPIQYDYALFGFSLDRRSPQEILSAQKAK